MRRMISRDRTKSITAVFCPMALAMAILGGGRSPSPSPAPASAEEVTENTEALARLGDFAGAWRCQVHHLPGEESPARDVRQRLDITLDPSGLEYTVRF